MSFKPIYPPLLTAGTCVANHENTNQEAYRAFDQTGAISGAGSGWYSATGVLSHRINMDYGDAAFTANYIHIVNYNHNGGYTDRGVKDVRIYGTNSATAFAETDPTVLTDLIKLGDFRVTQYVAAVINGEYFTLNTQVDYRYYVFMVDSTWGDDCGLRRIEFGRDIAFVRDVTKKHSISIPPQNSELIDFPFLLNISENSGTTNKDLSEIIESLTTESINTVWMNGFNTVLSDNDKLIQRTTGMGNAYGNKDLQRSSGKFYFEIVCKEGHQWIGVVSDYGENHNVAKGYGYYAYSGNKAHDSLQVAYGDNFGPNAVIGMAVDIDTGKIWWSKDGVWQASGDPAAGTNAAYTDVTGPCIPYLGMAADSTAAVPIYSEASDLIYDPPEGFDAGFYSTPVLKPKRVAIVDEFTSQECCAEIERAETISKYEREEPPAFNDTYVKATDYSSTEYYPWFAADPSLSLTGAMANNSWFNSTGAVKKLNIDYGTAFVANRIYLENGHASGTVTERGVKDFEVYGTNSATAFENVTYANLDGLTLLGGFIAAEHVASDVADPQYFYLDNNDLSFRYYVIRLATVHSGGYLLIRHIEMQSGHPETLLWVKSPSLSDSLYRTFHIYHDVDQVDNNHFIGHTDDDFKFNRMSAGSKGTAVKVHDLGSLDDGNSDLTDFGTQEISDNYYTFNGTNNGLYRASDLGDSSNEVCFVRVRIHDKDKGVTQVIWRDGGAPSGIAAGIDASGNLGIFGRSAGTLSSITMASDTYSNDVWYDIYFTKTAVTVLFSETGLLHKTITGTCSATDGASPESIAYVTDSCPISGGTDTNFNFFDGDIALVEIYADSALSAPVLVTSAQQVWDENFVAVYHMSQDPSGGTDCILDSTLNENHGTPSGSMTSDDLVDGLIGKALEFDGSDDYIRVTDDSTLKLTTGLSLETFFNADAVVNTGVISKTSLSNDPGDYQLAIAPDGWQFGINTGAVYTTGGSPSTGTWKYYVGTYDKVHLKSIVDSVDIDDITTYTADINTSTNDVIIGGYYSASHTFDGLISEVRVSNIARSADWIEATNLSLIDNLITFTEPWDEDKKIIITIPPQDSELVNFPVLLDFINGGVTNLDMSAMLEALKEDGIDIDFDPDNKDVKWTVYGNYIATHTGADGWADCATLPLLPTNFLYYFEIIWSGGAPNFSASFCPTDYDFTANVSGAMEDCWTVVEGGEVYNPADSEVADVFASAVVADDVIGFAIDPTTGDGWISKNGVFEGTQNPEAGTGAVITNLPLGWLFGVSCYSAHTCTLYINKEVCAYEPPEGFSYLHITDKTKSIAVVNPVTQNQCYVEREIVDIDTYPPSLVLLIPSDTTDGSTDFEEKIQGRVLTPSGSVQHSTTQSKFGGSSIHFNGTTDYISTPSFSDLAFGAGDFTIAAWLYCESDVKAGFIKTSSYATGVTLAYYNGKMYVSVANALVMVDMTLPLNIWKHWMLTRKDGVIYFLLQGVLQFSRTLSNSVTATTSMMVGYDVDVTGTYFQGYVDELTINKGIALHIDDFTPPESPQEKHNSVVLWSKVPNISIEVPTELHLYYDREREANLAYIGDTGEAAAQQVWDDNFVAVYHMEQDPSGTAPQILDSTSNEYGLTATNLAASNLVDGFIGKAIDFDSDSLLEEAVISLTSSFSVEYALKTETLVDYNHQIGAVNGWGPFSNHTAANGMLYCGTDQVNRFEIAGFYAANTEYVIAYTYDGSQGRVYKNGTLDTGPSNQNSPTAWGGFKVGSVTNAFGIWNEIRVSNVERSDNWLAVTNLSLTDSLVTFSFPVLEVEGGIVDRNIPAFSNFPKPYNTNFLPDFIPSGLIRQNRKGFSKAF